MHTHNTHKHTIILPRHVQSKYTHTHTHTHTHRSYPTMYRVSTRIHAHTHTYTPILPHHVQSKYTYTHSHIHSHTRTYTPILPHHVQSKYTYTHSHIHSHTRTHVDQSRWLPYPTMGVQILENGLPFNETVHLRCYCTCRVSLQVDRCRRVPGWG